MGGTKKKNDGAAVARFASIELQYRPYNNYSST
jgi:hypothetical protein